ncbi:MAG: cytochrome c3 family protein [Rhodothermales bacterium]
MRSILLLFAGLLVAMPLRAQVTPQGTSPHGDLTIGVGCDACHKTEGWTPLREPLAFSHSMQTGFPLTGSHNRVACASCHIDLRFDEPAVAATECATCHVDVHQGAYLEACVDCHNTTLFQDVEGIAIHTRTSFPLTGTHAQLNCTSCHTNDTGGAFTAIETECASCHQEDYDGARSIDHVAAGFPTECETCHNAVGWQGAVFEHAIASNGFSLLGAHDALACAACHRSPDLTPIFSARNDQDCYSCHQEDYDDHHANTGFPTTCVDCHSPDSWDGAAFDHVLASDGFALLGAHETLQCESCHSLPDLTPLFNPAGDQDCITCHQPDYNANHAGSGFPTTCLNCHGTTTWEGADFDHVAASNGFALVGAHNKLACENCHSLPDLTPLFNPSDNEDCITCHQPDYNANHAGSGFPTTCLECHNTTDWDDTSAFDHDGLYFRIYSGKHRGRWSNNCQTCHLQANNYPYFSCEGACHQHTQTRMDNEHRGKNGYAFDFPTCLNCHARV